MHGSNTTILGEENSSSNSSKNSTTHRLDGLTIVENNDVKRRKENVCTACLGIFQGDMIEDTVQEIINNTNLKMYECDTIYTSVSLPILLQIRELSLWLAMIRQFPDAISTSKCRFCI